jgi:hypothetical protein
MSKAGNDLSVGAHYSSFHVLESVFQFGKSISGRSQKFFDGRNEPVHSSGWGHVTLCSMILQFLLDGPQTASQLIHFFVQFSQTARQWNKFWNKIQIEKKMQQRT